MPWWWLAGLACVVGAGWLLWREALPRRKAPGAFRPGAVHATARPTTAPRTGDRSSGAAALPRAAAPVGPTLFRFVTRPAWAERLESRLPAPARSVRYVQPNRALLEGKASPFWQPPGEGRFAIETPDGQRLPVRIRQSQQLAADRMVSEGWIEGQPASRFLLSAQDVAGGPTQITASVLDVSLPEGDDPAGGTSLQNFTLRATGVDEAQFYRIDDARVLPCGAEVRPERGPTATVAAAWANATTAALRGRSAAEAAALASGAPVTLDLLLLYTKGILESLPLTTTAARVAAIQSTFDNAVAEANSDLARSGISAQLRLVKVAAVDYDESLSEYAKVNADALKALRLPADGKMDEIHALRDAVGADLVSLAVVPRDNTSSGIGYLLATPASVDMGDALINDQFGFSIVQYHALTGTSLLAHELGHNLGAQHDRENSKDNTGALTTGAFSYSYGYRFFGRDGRQYRTIMAYAPGTRVHYFSNPDLVASEPELGVPVGLALGAAGECHNALTIQRCAFEASGYRLQRQDTADRGTLVNVSTRAWVGAGERQMLGGFMIDGPASKRVLLRALGASLASFGVTDGLPNPTLALLRMPTGSRVAFNDDWINPVAASVDLSAVGHAIGAFPLTGARDAALLVTLAPGSYSANVEAADGVLGTALLEAYEVDANEGARLINLSTRAWADRGKPIIAGFTVRGTPGQTKRILVRVLGPTLAQYQVAEPMADPQLDLYGANGTWLLANDDWSTGAAYVSGQRDDFRPSVQYYHEKEIDQTGLAPKNRREPAVLLDLPPGLYTAVVQPFENLATQQPAAPGVAIVEV